MDKLIQTSKCSIIYGNFKGTPNQELFRCSRGLEDTDLRRYVNENRCLLGFENAKESDYKDKEPLDYWRMYFRGCWDGRWMGTAYGGYDEKKLTKLDCYGAGQIFDWFIKEFPRGCDWKMEKYLEENFKPISEDGKRYFIKPLYSDKYIICCDTTYGNGDYPVRIYVYK